MNLTGNEWHTASPAGPSSRAPDFQPVKTDKLEEIKLDDPKATPEDACEEASQVYIRWAHSSEVMIAPPSQVHISEDRELYSGLRNQITDSKFLEPVWSEQQSSPPSILVNDSKDASTGTHEQSASFDEEAVRTSNWLSRLSAPWAFTRDTLEAANNQAYPSDGHGSDSRWSQTTVHTNTHSELDRTPSLTNKQVTNGFVKTTQLLANLLKERTTESDTSKSCSRPTSLETLTPDTRNPYEVMAEKFIQQALEFFRHDRGTHGPGATLYDYEIMRLFDPSYMKQERGKRGPFLFGEWEFLWVIDKDDEVPSPVKSPENVGSESMRNRSWLSGYRMPTAEDWKWWFGEWRKLPGAVWEWKPREEIWPWQREFWTEMNV